MKNETGAQDEIAEVAETKAVFETGEAAEARVRMIQRFRTIRIVSGIVFVLTVVALIAFVRSGMAAGDVQNIRFALLYVFGAVVIALSITVVIACHVILGRLKKNEAAEG